MSIGVKLSQTIYSERDKSKPCVNYPTEKYVSYEDCDQSTVYQNVLDKFNLVPFWSARSLDEVSMTRYLATLGPWCRSEFSVQKVVLHCGGRVKNKE